ncbi:hypothetical protein [Streptosporangium sp. NPDC000396]|uniref:hypothetical protein n=1 Tax=Streptosporangium sp. NPDC000396 TaxID=3366185 RepID=UPI0036C38285
MIRLRPSRAPGRHRTGLPRTAVHRRLWDGPARTEAERLDQVWPDWTVLYGAHSRLFYAIAAWPAPEPVIVQAATSEGLEALMHEAAMTWAVPHQAFATGVSVLVSLEQARRQPHFPGTRCRTVVPVLDPRHPYRNVS